MSGRGPPPYIDFREKHNTEDPRVTTAKLVKSVLITALLISATAHAAEQQPIVVVLEEGKQIASFNMGRSRCVLKNDQIRCVPVNIK